MKTLTFFEIPDDLWERTEPLLAQCQPKRAGGAPGIPYRTLLTGILFKLKTGCQWSMIPKQYGSKSTLHEHYQRWVSRGIFEQILRCISEEYDEKIGFNTEWQSMDGSIVQSPVRKKEQQMKA